MELAKGFAIPLKPDPVLDPEVYYDPDPKARSITGIYFQTEDDQFGRMTFENLDAIRISRGEYLPYADDWQEGQPYCWVTTVEHSNWLKQRYAYEKKHYGDSYEFGGNVEDMLTDFKHYVFSFHDQFIEVIARGFWFEKDAGSLFGRPLLPGHPFLPLPETQTTEISAHGLISRVRINPEHIETLKTNTRYCSQPLMEFMLQLAPKTRPDHFLQLIQRNGQVVSKLSGLLGNPIQEFTGVATLAQVQPYIEQYMQKIAKRRKEMHTQSS